MDAGGERVKNGPMLTDQQRRALTTRGASIALSAGAGCGKTFVLTERFLAALEPDGVSTRSRLGQVVAITFTERAAREMRDRIRKACNRRLLECPEDQAGYWLELVRDLDSARISTIHSFCGSLLRSHAVEAGIDPRFRVLDGAQSGTLLFELTDDVLRSRLSDRVESVLTLVARFGLNRLRTMIARLLAQRQEVDWPVWREETADGLVRRWSEMWHKDTVPRVLRRIGKSQAVRTILDLATRYPPAHPKMRERCEFLRAELPKLAAGEAAASPQEWLLAIREAAKVQGGGTKKDWVSEEVFEQFKNAAKALRDAIDNVKQHMQFDLLAARPAAELALDVLRLADGLAVEYDKKKQELGVLDFNDLLIRARLLLVGPENAGLRQRLASQIQLLLIDEFQDTDPLQVEMVKALCDHEYLRGRLFLVGDYKQSIYRFRGADPHVFRRLREELPEAGRLPLSLNFRSQPAVIEFVNALFCEELGPKYEPLQAHRPQVSPTPAVELLWACDNPDSPDADAERVAKENLSFDDFGPRERLQRREADWIARRIRAMLDAGEKIVWDEEAAKAGTPATRPPRPGDFTLLFRALTNIEYYEDALRRYGIDYYLVGGHAFYAQQEIYDLLNLLRAINCSCDEVSLVGALRSPMFGMDDETLLWLAQHHEGVAGGLFDKTLPVELNAEQRETTQAAATTLGELRAVKDRMPVAKLIGEALERTGYDALLLAEFLGERKLANLHKLIEQARSFDRAGVFTLSDFITQLSEFVARQPDEALAATHPESTDVVKLMSIHQSKGLEFPIVIVPDVGRPRRVMGPPMAFTPQLGPMFKDTAATTGYDLFMMAENEEELAEASRLLYVAATRAADYLILSAGVEQPDEPIGPWMGLIAERFDLLSGEEKGTVGRRLYPVRVTATEPQIGSKRVDLRNRCDLLKMLEDAKKKPGADLDRQLRFMTPIVPDASARQQYSFSRLTGKLHTRAIAPDQSLLDAEASAEPPVDARGFGTLTHAVLAEIGLTKRVEIGELVARLAVEHQLSSERVGEMSDMLERFLASPRAAAMAGAKQTHRELEFLLAWPPGGGCPNGRVNENGAVPLETSVVRYLQGFIDCIYCDPAGQWHIVDYKTNRTTVETLPGVAAEYEMQMLVYALAAEEILRHPPVELVLYFLRPGVEHRFVWDGAARRRAIELVDRALPQCGLS